MYYDRFDIASAYYLFFVHYHEGQWSEKYRRLSKLTGYFRPGLSVENGELSENAQAIYDALVEKEGAKQ